MIANLQVAWVIGDGDQVCVIGSPERCSREGRGGVEPELDGSHDS